MTTINDRYQEALFRHAIGVEGYEEYLAATLAEILRKTEDDLIGQIFVQYEKLGTSTTGRHLTKAKLKRLNAMLGKIKELRNTAWADVNMHLRSELWDFANVEADFVRDAFEKVVGLEGISLAAPSAAVLRSAVFTDPFRLNDKRSGTLAEWMAGLRESDQDRIHDALRMGYIEGQPVETVIQRIRGTRAGQYRDGILQTTRRGADAIVRTGLLHFGNSARDLVWAGNADVIGGLVWTSTLDGRTTPVCQARSGRIAMFGNREVPKGFKLLVPANARPPAHALCRSLMVAVIDGVGMIGTRPFVVDTRTGKQLKIDFRKLARQNGTTIGVERKKWAVKHVGRAPSKTTYEDFLRNQSIEFQDEVLGPTRGKLFREGGLTLDDLVDRSGRQYNLAELRSRDAEAFFAAGL